MRHPTTWRLRDSDDEDDDDDDDENEEEQPDDNVRSIFVHFRMYAFSSNDRVMIVRVSVFRDDRKTCATEGDFGWLG